MHYESMISLSPEGMLELIENLDHMKGRPLHLPPPEMIIFSDAAKLGSSVSSRINGGSVVRLREGIAHKRPGVAGCRTSLKNFHKRLQTSLHSPENRQHLSPVIHSQHGGTQSLTMLTITKRIWEYLLLHQITITAEWIPSHLNWIADWESRNVADSSEWMLCPNIFTSICQLMGQPDVDLFA